MEDAEVQESALELACIETAAKNGHTAEDAADCEAGSVDCPDCPFHRFDIFEITLCRQSSTAARFTNYEEGKMTRQGHVIFSPKNESPFYWCGDEAYIEETDKKCWKCNRPLLYVNELPEHYDKLLGELEEAQKLIRALLGAPPPRTWKKWPNIYRSANEFLSQADWYQESK